ncbi:hypothetical protein TTHERM_000242068 (macronuclear) [Tetrahymena thermophila SB210]|uniref:Uncharacterized protein n=1 Tax=Tetrahymena thermophila (strain SB210) TaxID=312017 RepID=W7XDB9_TETTS|nr:hypothetical protein TTHERM_000242068 [Tetrahymena thermophila SB210]EWS71796.1 hypothetical protein TTHERM_000242068 [Tetrahymena thermophila SB210]|eukprot:XP_012655683.1 hypothetical protein TTHERM_000242068 [Tetrahymena thermophila SB210]
MLIATKQIQEIKNQNQFLLFSIIVSYQNKSQLQSQEKNVILKPIQIKAMELTFIGLNTYFTWYYQQQQYQVICQKAIKISNAYIKYMLQNIKYIVKYAQTISTVNSRAVNSCQKRVYRFKKTNMFRQKRWIIILIKAFINKYPIITQKTQSLLPQMTINILSTRDRIKIKNILIINLLTKKYMNLLETISLSNLLFQISFYSIIQNLINISRSRDIIERTNVERAQIKGLPSGELVFLQYKQFCINQNMAENIQTTIKDTKPSNLLEKWQKHINDMQNILSKSEIIINKILKLFILSSAFLYLS